VIPLSITEIANRRKADHLFQIVFDFYQFYLEIFWQQTYMLEELKTLLLFFRQKFHPVCG
jgi:hypothetical protein